MNAVISKRFAKRQQMQWTKRGAHLLRQTRTRALDGTLRRCSSDGIPDWNDNAAEAAQARGSIKTPEILMFSLIKDPPCRGQA